MTFSCEAELTTSLMSLSAPFTHRPVATTLLTVALGMPGGMACNSLPEAPLPQVDFPSPSAISAFH